MTQALYLKDFDAVLPWSTTFFTHPSDALYTYDDVEQGVSYFYERKYS